MFYVLIVSIPDINTFTYFVFVLLSRLFIAALWSPAGRGLTSWLSFLTLNCVFCTYLCGFADHCHLSYFYLYT